MSQSKNLLKDFGSVKVHDELILDNSVPVHFGRDDEDGFDISFDGSNTLNIDALVANDTIRIGETTQADLQVDGASDLLWDASVGSLTNGGFFIPVIPNAVREVLAAGNTTTAASVATYGSDVSVDAGGDIFTLAAGTVVGQLKEFTLDATAGGVATITPATFADGTSVTLTAAGDQCIFDVGWCIRMEINTR